MTKAFTMKLNQIQPSQLYISSEKLTQVMKSFDLLKPESLEPIPVLKLGNQIIFTDGHTRAFAAFLRGLSEVRVFWDEDELGLEEYAICVEWCKKEGIGTIADLKNRVVSPDEYEALWLKRYEKMQQDLKAAQNKR